MADRIEDLIAKWPVEVQAALLQALRERADRIVISRLTELIRAGDVDGAIREVGLDPAVYRRLDASLSAAYEASGGQAAAAISTSRLTAGRVLFDFNAFAADDWRKRNNGQLIQDLLTEDGALMRETLGGAIAKGQNPHDVALELSGRINKATGHREGGLIGLTRPQAEWSRTYEAELTGVPSENALTRQLRDHRFDRSVAKAIRNGEPLPAELRRKMVAAYRSNAVKYRAEQISQAEARKAIGAAQIEAYRQASEAGAIDADQVVRRWITKGDSKVRPEHRLIPGLNPNGVGLLEPFITPSGPCMFPPLDFGCRCLVRMELKAARVALAA